MRDKNRSRPVYAAAILVLTMLSIFLYLGMRTLLFLSADLGYADKAFAFALLFAEFFVFVHGFGYFLNIFHVLRSKKTLGTAREPQEELYDYPPVAVIVSSYKEPLPVVEDTLTCFYNLSYPNKHLYFLDDTRYDLPWADLETKQKYRDSIDALCREIGVNLFRRRWHGAKAGMINDFLDFIEGRQKEGFEFNPYEEAIGKEKEKYIAVFDADMNPFPDFLEPLVAKMEKNPRLAFIQTPQYYTNFERNRMARASGLQQAVFYEYICEGKSLKEAIFCCGTNVLFRREALIDVGGFDEASVTEDFATSFKFHIRGWHSAYVNRPSAFGMGPEDLGSYFKQQFRWALGTIGLLRYLLGEFLRGPLRLPPGKWWEYFLSGSYYFIGWVFAVMAICPVLYLFFDVPSYFADPALYLIFFSPNIIIMVSVFFWTLRERNYRMKEIALGLMLSPAAFPIYMKSALLALLGVKGKFTITPKEGVSILPLRYLWPQIALSVLNFSGMVWGANRMYYERENIWALAANSFWCLYFFIALSFVFYFNNPEEGQSGA